MPNRISAFTITFIYLIIGILWIILTDKILFAIFNNAQQLSLAQTYKGWLYVGITSIILYLLLRINERKIVKTKFQAQEEYRQLVEQLPGVVFMDVFNDPQTTHYMSPRIKDLVGYTAEEWTKDGRDMWSISLHPDDIERVLNEDKRTNQTGESFRIEYRLKHKDGHYVWVKEDASLVKGEDGAPLFWQGILLDITEQKKAEELSRWRDEVLRESTMELTHYVDLNNLFEKIFSSLYKLIQFDSASIELVNGDTAEIVAGKNIPKEMIGRKYQVNPKKWGDLYSLRNVQIIPDVQKDERFVIFDETNYIRSWMGIPLMVQEKLIGFLNLDSRMPNYFNYEFASLAQTFANQAAIAIENVKLYTETKQRLQELETVSRVSSALRAAKDTNEMFPILLSEIKSIIQTDAATVFLFDEEKNALTVRATSGWLADLPKSIFAPSEGIVGTVYSKGIVHTSPEFISDPMAHPQNANFFGEGWGGIAVPIRTANEIIGVIIVGIQKPRQIEDGYIRLLTTIAEIAGNAIYRSNLFDRNEEQIRRLTTLREIDTAITSSLDLRITLNIILEHLVTKMNVSAASFLIFNPDSQMLDTLAASGFQNQEMNQTSFNVGEGLATQILLNRKPIHVKDLNNESQQITGENFSSYYALPLFSKGTTRGVIETYFKHTFTPNADWIDFVQTLVGQATIAIDNAQLFENLQRSNQELSLAYDTTLEGWGKALELRDKETQGHTQRVTNLTLELAQRVGIPESQLTHIRRGALLHDIGKMGVSDKILRKPSALTEDEMNEMKKHPQYAYELLYPIPYLRAAVDIPYCHHEWWDGSGYPRGLKGEEIPLAARIFAVVDVWDALLSDRPYRKAWNQADTCKYILSLSGKQFDPRVVDEFKRIIDNEPDIIESNYPQD
jgi:PAS domain S-box-containing protein